MTWQRRRDLVPFAMAAREDQLVRLVPVRRRPAEKSDRQHQHIRGAAGVADDRGAALWTERARHDRTRIGRPGEGAGLARDRYVRRPGEQDRGMPRAARPLAVLAGTQEHGEHPALERNPHSAARALGAGLDHRVRSAHAQGLHRRRAFGKAGTRHQNETTVTVIQVPLPAAARFAPDYPIGTDRLELRPFSRADVDAVYSYRSMPDVAEYLFDEPMTREDCAEAVRVRAGQVAFAAEGDKILLGVERRDDRRLVGEVSLIWRSLPDRQAEIGYILHPDAQGHGYATEAAAALLDFGFGKADLHRIYARCDARNERSARVMRRLGMRQEAYLREHTFHKGRWADEQVWAILVQEWGVLRDKSRDVPR